MQEVLSKTDDPKVPLRDQEFYELRLYDSKSSGALMYYVREARATWDDEAERIVWDEELLQALATYQEARERYEARRLALGERGFIYSDMDI